MNPSSRPNLLKVGVVGAGRIATNVHLPVLLNLPGVTVSWIADRDSGRASSVARAFGVAAAGDNEMPEADILLLAIPLPGRADWISAYWPRGTAILLEKPVAQSGAEHEALLASLPDVHRLAVGYQRRFHATSAFARAATKQEWFGRLRRIVHREGARATRAGASDYQDVPTQAGGGITKNLACHGLDLAAYVAGADAFGTVESEIVWDGETDRRVETRLQLTGEADGIELDLIVSGLEAQSNEIVFEFDHAKLRCSIAPSREIRIGKEGGWTTIEVGNGATTSYQAFFLEWMDFVTSFRAGRPARIAAAANLVTSRLIDAVLEKGRWTR